MDKHLIQSVDSKKDRLDALRPLDQAHLKNLEEWYKVELTYTSNAIEGNTLTRSETALVIEKGITVKGKSLDEHLEAKNHVIALDYIKGLVYKKREEITEDDILQIHALILQGIDDPNAGRYRSVPVRIVGSRAIMPNYMKVPNLMHDFIKWLQSPNDDHIVKIASDAHYKLVSMHPFVDGNGRTSRLLMNLILMQSGYPPVIVRLEDRQEYIDALEKAHMGGSLDNFYSLVFKSMSTSLDIYLGKDIADSTENTEEDSALINRSDLADIAGLRSSTIKYYTEKGILPYIQKEEGLRRYYDKDSSIQRLKDIEKLKLKGLSIDEIKQELGL